MQTVNFKCGHCGNLMGVSKEHLGQQVRCPSCQQVVLAPVPASEGDGSSPFERNLAGAIEASEDIFSPPPSNEDALFGGAEGPKLEVPLDNPASRAPSGAPSPEPAGSPALFPTTFADHPTNGHTNGEPGSAQSPLDGLTAPAPALAEVPPARRREPAKVNWLLPLVVFPLLIWALGATAAAIWGWSEVVKANRRPSLFEQFPDLEGDHPGVRKGKPTSRLNWSRERATEPLPARLLVPLGGVLTLGDLEIRPLRVERKKVSVFTEGEPRAQPQAHESLVLTLRLTNLAEDYSFTPLDNHFDRRWEGSGSPPLTLVQAGKKQFWGGSHDWSPVGSGPRRLREWLDGPGRSNFDPAGLGPGASVEAVVATNGEDPEVQRFLFGLDADGQAVGTPYSGPLLWRVHVRRGLVNWRDRSRPACAVIGVELDSSAYLGK